MQKPSAPRGCRGFLAQANQFLRQGDGNLWCGVETEEIYFIRERLAA
jgi:hypothetical protein